MVVLPKLVGTLRSRRAGRAREKVDAA
jgi:hypothetical protein